MKQDELEAIKRRHERAKEAYADFQRGYGSVTYCNLCRQKWPCDAFRAAIAALGDEK